jgi:hypothetical protein
MMMKTFPHVQSLDAIVGGVAAAHLSELHRARLSVSSNVDGQHSPLPWDPAHAALPSSTDGVGYAAQSVTYVQPGSDHAGTATPHASPFWNTQPHGGPPALTSSSYSGGTNGIVPGLNPYAQSSTYGSNPYAQSTTTYGSNPYTQSTTTYGPNPYAQSSTYGPNPYAQSTTYGGANAYGAPAAYAVVMGDGSVHLLPGPPAAYSATTSSTMPGAQAVTTQQNGPLPNAFSATTTHQTTPHTYVAADVWLQVEQPALPTIPRSGDGGGGFFGGLFDDSDPLLLDLNGHGVNLTSAHDGVNFDINGDGVQERVAWTQANGADTNAWLVRDDSHDGGQAGIQSGLELFGDQHGDANGFERLRQFDDNHDGVFDQHDAAFNDMQLWQDLNHDGISQTNELASLADRGVTSIQLTPNQPAGQLADGTRVLGSTYTRNV